MIVSMLNSVNVAISCSLRLSVLSCLCCCPSFSRSPPPPPTWTQDASETRPFNLRVYFGQRDVDIEREWTRLSPLNLTRKRGGVWNLNITAALGYAIDRTARCAAKRRASEVLGLVFSIEAGIRLGFDRHGGYQASTHKPKRHPHRRNKYIKIKTPQRIDSSIARMPAPISSQTLPTGTAHDTMGRSSRLRATS